MTVEFEAFVGDELPIRPIMWYPDRVDGYDGDPNDGAAPNKLKNSPVGTFYSRPGSHELWQKEGGGPGTWRKMDGGSGSSSNLSHLNRRMAALVTTVDGSLACATAVGAVVGDWILVLVNGLAVEVGDGVKTGCNCYFSKDLGVTPTGHGAITTADLLYWNGSTCFQLNEEDVIDFIFDE
jgi:hypothetical protein